MPITTRRRLEYTQSKISLYIPENYDERTIKYLQKDYLKVYNDAHNYTGLIPQDTGRIEPITSEMVYNANISNGNRYCILIQGTVLDIYYILDKGEIYDILESTLLDFYVEAFKNMPISNGDYNRIIKVSKCKKKDVIFCPLRSENIKVGNLIAETPCGHKFASKELRKWLTNKCTKPECPMCRHNMTDNLVSR